MSMQQFQFIGNLKWIELRMNGRKNFYILVTWWNCLRHSSLRIKAIKNFIFTVHSHHFLIFKQKFLHLHPINLFFSIVLYVPSYSNNNLLSSSCNSVLLCAKFISTEVGRRRRRMNRKTRKKFAVNVLVVWNKFTHLSIPGARFLFLH
jgi:hypothetical protein